MAPWAAYGSSPSPAPRRPAKRSATPIVLVLSVVLGIAAYVVARNVTIDVLSSRGGRDGASSTSSPSSPSPTSDREVPGTTAATSGTRPAGTTPPAEPAKRYQLTSGEVSWTLRADAIEDPISVPAPGGGTLEGFAMAADVGTMGAQSADLVIVYQLEGRTFDLEDGVKGAVEGNHGEVIEGPSPITVGGRPGVMVTGTFERSGLTGIVRWGGVQVGDRVFVFGTVDEGDDLETGKQDFADLIASVRVDA